MKSVLFLFGLALLTMTGAFLLPQPYVRAVHCEHDKCIDGACRDAPEENYGCDAVEGPERCYSYRCDIQVE